MMTQYNVFGDDVTVIEPKSKKVVEVKKGKVVNVSSVPQRSPFRYPGGKTWLIPTVRQWLKQNNGPTPLLVEPFAGGGIVSLTAVAENLAERVEMVELDIEVSAVWQTVSGTDNQWLAERILSFNLTIENVTSELAKPNKSTRDIAFCTILKNRVNHGGILAAGSGMLKVGENGKGIASRWYPETLAKRITEIDANKDRITAIEGDAFESIQRHTHNTDCYFFIDPPYVVAGKRLYTHFNISHEQLLEYTAGIRGKFLLTYDDAPEIRELADGYNLPYTTIPMKTTHHQEKRELLISDNLRWL